MPGICGQPMLTLLAPAKVNLSLEVLYRRKDGYHELRSIIQSLSLCDRLSFSPSKTVHISSDSQDWQADLSLVSKAVELFSERCGQNTGVNLKIAKRIPLVSGLGGDSSCAAAVLKGLNKLWGCGYPCWRLMEIGAELGSDVPFFIMGGTAMMEGRGETVTPLPTLTQMWAVLLVPALDMPADKTAALYRNLRPDSFTSGEISDKLLESICQGKLSLSLCFNAFEKVAFELFPELVKYRWQFLEAGAYQISLAGAGPTLFTLLKDKNTAEKIYHNLCQKGHQAYLVSTLGPLD
ncbi:4-diphosphocytidyl-2-C-methyl-D-erythritol kinase [Dehalococcoides mccartyi]|nr:4-diphosphocytidyl-2-C-methyl-D-erythritol kinase [Dehalococcoides mccartyi DCMB5]AGG07478.1 4-diphosphocytidyl-2-C-methyl-D-erythritol kinase [Dehalococcoides mccartyi BTF08]AOV99011.1 4-diphosphocytidyl-2-C-methyl-D-erythritol kinase [Dehalococcoides mccartyi]MBA2084783.1 4-diphosphocytidyl-2-C-methyl-D-erythritol kinase [Dehalococcoides mccartyi]